MLQFAGPSVSSEAFFNASMAKILAESSNLNLEISGEPSKWFSPRTTIENDVNLLIHFEDLEHKTTRNQNRLQADDLSVNLNNASSTIKALFRRGITQRSPNCFGDWMATQDNEILSAVHIIDTSATLEEQRSCARSMLPLTFGIFPVVTTLDYSALAQGGGSGVFFDESEVFLLLRIASFCKDELKNETPSCSINILRNLYELHEETFK